MSGVVELRIRVEMFCVVRWIGRLAVRLARKRARRARRLNLEDILGSVSLVFAGLREVSKVSGYSLEVRWDVDGECVKRWSLRI